MLRKSKNQYFLSNQTCKTRITIFKLRPKPSNQQNTKTSLPDPTDQTPNFKTQLRPITIFSWQPNKTMDLQNPPLIHHLPPPSNPTNGPRKSKSTHHCLFDFLDLLSTSLPIWLQIYSSPPLSISTLTTSTGDLSPSTTFTTNLHFHYQSTTNTSTITDLTPLSLSLP